MNAVPLRVPYAVVPQTPVTPLQYPRAFAFAPVSAATVSVAHHRLPGVHAGGAATTAAVAALVSSSPLPASSSNVTFTLTVLPWSATTSV